MTDKINDWAIEIARDLTDNWTYSHSVDSSRISAALRKAKADGMREAAESCIELGRFYPESEARQALLRIGLDFKAVADKIERGEAWPKMRQR
jgi:uncharacterized pyridoxal phosphate-containing UPF0001 family protein